MKTLPGIAASRGIGIGPAFHFRRTGLRFEHCTVEHPAAEWARFHAAMTQARGRAHEPAVTRDGRRVEVVANVGNVTGAKAALELDSPDAIQALVREQVTATLPLPPV